MATSTAASGTAKTGASKPAAPPVLTHITVYSVNSDAPVFTSIVSGLVLTSAAATSVGNVSAVGEFLAAGSAVLQLLAITAC